MWHRVLGSGILTLTFVTGAAAQTTTLTADEAIRLALQQNPTVTAAQARLEAATAGVRGARAPFNLQGEVTPGVGFTNGNALLSQEFDLGGRRAAQTQAAQGQRAAAEAELALARLQVATQARASYFDLTRAQAVERAAAEAAALARQVRDAVRRRVDLGEAPAVQLTRGEIEVGRAEQEVARAQGDVRARLATLNVLLGRAPETAVTPTEVLTLPAVPPGAQELAERALRQRPELAAGRGLLEARRGQVEVARAQRRPALFAEVASDIWSLDRDPFQTRNLGLQARVSFPLFDRGRLRAEVDRAQAGVREQEAELAVAARTVNTEVQQAAAALTAAREVALNYQQTILPRSEDLLRATRAGFETGLSSFLDVLEAQRVHRQTQTEYLNALYEAVRARTALERAVGGAPGSETPAERRSNP